MAIWWDLCVRNPLPSPDLWGTWSETWELPVFLFVFVLVFVFVFVSKIFVSNPWETWSESLKVPVYLYFYLYFYRSLMEYIEWSHISFLGSSNQLRRSFVINLINMSFLFQSRSQTCDARFSWRALKIRSIIILVGTEKTVEKISLITSQKKWNKHRKICECCPVSQLIVR